MNDKAYTRADAETASCEPRAVEKAHPQASIMYAPKGSVSHIVWTRGVLSGGREAAICGVEVVYGTGDWGERVKARRMPLCAVCARSEINVAAVAAERERR